MNWRRQYKTGHFFFIPLFSFGEQHQCACDSCGYVADGRYPVQAPPLPWVDRMGFLIPLGIFGSGIFGLVALISAAIVTAPPPKAPTAAVSEKTALERRLVKGTSAGDTDLERKLAATVFETLKKDEGLPPAEVAVAVRVKQGVTRHVLVLVQVQQLRQMRPKARRDLVDDVRKAIADDLEAEDVVTVAVKGTVFYGALSQGPEGGDASLEIDDLVPTEHVEKAFEAALAGGDGTAVGDASNAAAADAGPPAADAGPPAADAAKR
jgi:hypothetical protein